MSFFLLCVFTLLFQIDGVFPKQICSNQDVLDYLNLTRHNEHFTTCRPALDWTHPTTVYLDMYLYGILSMIEKSQIFVPLLWMSMSWQNERISWNPDDFCGIDHVILPKDMLWKPDLYILETAEKEDGPLTPYLRITHDGNVLVEDDHKIVSTCTMNVHRFPFDTQTCHITVSSLIYTDKEMQLLPASNSSKATQLARENLLTQGEWEFLNVSVCRLKENYDGHTFDRIKYTISLRRLPLMHFINFQLPILFFVILDLASFLLPDTGDKLSFKVTVLLAISVLLLILNDILPSKSHRCPLIATFVIVIFTLMLLSLLETILVIYLININSEQDHNFETDKLKGCRNDHTSHSEEEASLESLKKMNEVNLLQLILEELQTTNQNLVPHFSKAQTCQRSWLGLVKCINRGFFVAYLISVSLFLGFIFREWKMG